MSTTLFTGNGLAHELCADFPDAATQDAADNPPPLNFVWAVKHCGPNDRLQVTITLVRAACEHCGEEPDQPDGGCSCEERNA